MKSVVLAICVGFLGCAGILLTPPGMAVAGDREVRQCTDAHVLNRISSRFDHQVRHVPGLPDVRITNFSAIHQHRYLPSYPDRPIARRYCHATVLLTDGHHRKIWYVIEDNMGLASIGSGVEFCVAGFDRWMVYDGSCRILR